MVFIYDSIHDIIKLKVSTINLGFFEFPLFGTLPATSSYPHIKTKKIPTIYFKSKTLSHSGAHAILAPRFVGIFPFFIP
jgi:hypothetical protein